MAKYIYKPEKGPEKRWLSLRYYLIVFVLTSVFSPLSHPDHLDLTPALLEQVKSRFGQLPHHRLLKLKTLINEAGSASELEKIVLVNAFFNHQVRFVEDAEHWGEKDYWATPMETVITEGGDCEDFSIAKYFTLLELGVPEEQLRLWFVHMNPSKKSHIVLGYYPLGQKTPLILDSLTDNILPASRRGDLVALYSFNNSGYWLEK